MKQSSFLSDVRCCIGMIPIMYSSDGQTGEKLLRNSIGVNLGALKLDLNEPCIGDSCPSEARFTRACTQVNPSVHFDGNVFLWMTPYQAIVKPSWLLPPVNLGALGFIQGHSMNPSEPRFTNLPLSEPRFTHLHPSEPGYGDDPTNWTKLE